MLSAGKGFGCPVLSKDSDIFDDLDVQTVAKVLSLGVDVINSKQKRLLRDELHGFCPTQSFSPRNTLFLLERVKISSLCHMSRALVLMQGSEVSSRRLT